MQFTKEIVDEVLELTRDKKDGTDSMDNLPKADATDLMKALEESKLFVSYVQFNLKQLGKELEKNPTKEQLLEAGASMLAAAVVMGVMIDRKMLGFDPTVSMAEALEGTSA